MSLTWHLARRLLPATILITVLVGVGAPALIWHFEMQVRLVVVLSLVGGGLGLFITLFPLSVVRRLDEEIQDQIAARTDVYLAAERHLAQTRRVTQRCRDIDATLDSRRATALAVTATGELFGAEAVRLWSAQEVPDAPHRDGERWIVPLVAGTQSHGALDFVIRDRAVDAVEEELIVLFASKVAIALENCDLHEATRRTLAELRTRNEELDGFLHTVSHDLTTPLVAIHGLAGALADHVGSDADATIAHYVGRISANVDHMERLLRDVVELSRVGRSGGVAGWVALTPLVKDVVDKLRRSHADPAPTVVVHPMDTVWGLESDVRRVVQSLLGNATKYVDGTRAPRIEVGSATRDGVTAYYVRDDGIGIDPAYHAKIFEVFQRLNGVEVEGSGLGLTIVRRIVEGGGGRVWVESQRGEGATFWFTWPAPTPARDAAPSRALSAAP